MPSGSLVIFLAVTYSLTSFFTKMCHRQDNCHFWLLCLPGQDCAGQDHMAWCSHPQEERGNAELREQPLERNHVCHI